MSWEVGRDGEEQPGLGREPVSSEDRRGHPAGFAVTEPGRTGATGGCQGTRAEHSLGSLQFCLGEQPWELESWRDDSSGSTRKRGIENTGKYQVQRKRRTRPWLVRPLDFKQQPQHHLWQSFAAGPSAVQQVDICNLGLWDCPALCPLQAALRPWGAQEGARGTAGMMQGLSTLPSPQGHQQVPAAGSMP